MSEYLLARRAKMFGTVQPEIKKVRTVIAKKSKSTKQQDKIYKPFVKEYLSRPENKYCKINSPVCTKIATTINHLKRRFKAVIMNEKYIEPCCENCNGFIEQFDSWAREHGHLLSKFN